MSAAGKLVRETRIARATGVTVEVVDADHPDCDEFQSDEGGRWVTVCRDHGEFVQHETWKLARQFLGHPEEWCEACRALAEEGGTGDPDGGFSEEERARAAETRRKKAEERRAAREAEEERKRAAAAINDQWTDWVVGQPMVDRVYAGDERERHEKAREDALDAKGKAATAKRGHRAAEASIGTVTKLKIKSKREKKNLERLEQEAADLDAEVVAQEDLARVLGEEQTRLARIAYLRGAIAAGWKLEAGRIAYISKGDRRLRVPDDFLEAEDYAEARRG